MAQIQGTQTKRCGHGQNKAAEGERGHTEEPDVYWLSAMVSPSRFMAARRRSAFSDRILWRVPERTRVKITGLIPASNASLRAERPDKAKNSLASIEIGVFFMENIMLKVIIKCEWV